MNAMNQKTFTRAAQGILRRKHALVLLWCVCFLLLSSNGLVCAQAAVYQRIIPRSVAEVKSTIQSLHAESSGRLPTLEGFTLEADQPLERYDKGYFECTFRIDPAVGGGTIIQATTKITAWYTDPVPGRSGYRVLVSNGRFENDFLDRIAEKLGAGVAPSPTPTPAASTSASATAPAVHLSAPSAPNSSAAPVANTAGLPPAPRFHPTGPGESSSLDSSSTSSRTTTNTPHAPAEPPAMPLPTGDSVESMKSHREADEKQARDLTAYINNLEEIQRNQSRPADLAAVINAKTPVFTKPLEGSRVLLSVDAQDEFQILGVEGAWVHVQISGASRGWIRRAQLEMPQGYVQATAKAVDSASASDAIFKVGKETTSTFTGSWETLKGKIVRVEWVEPVSPSSTSSAKEKLAFAKSIFLHTYSELKTANQSAEGIVVVFDSSDGGQIAASMPSVQGLAGRAISDAAFWRQCSLDPPESFQDSPK